MADTLELGGSELGEHLPGQLHAAVEGASEREHLHGEAQPGLAEQCIALRHSALQGARIPRTDASTYQT